MTFKEIMVQLFAEPFQPVRIHTTSGRIFDVCYPDAFALGKTKLSLAPVFVDIPDAKGPWYDIALAEIQSVVALPRHMLRT